MMNLKQANEIMTICATTEAILDGNSELLDLIAEQSIDSHDKVKGEYLGGNGVAGWNHCKGHIIENSGADSDSLGEDDGLERAILRHAVAEHQTGIESNGVYNVRQLAHWKGGFDGEIYAKRNERVAAKNASHGYKIDRRRKPGTTKAERIAAKLAKLDAKRNK